MGSKSIKAGSIEEQAVADLCKRSLSYTKTTILINCDCFQKDRATITHSAVHTCKQNMMRKVLNIERCPQGKKGIGSMWA